MDIFEPGKMVEHFWLELGNKFCNVKLHNFVVMPNHFHGIVEIVENEKSQNTLNNTVGADLCVCPEINNTCPDDKKLNNKSNGQSGGTQRFTPTNGEFIYNKNSISSIVKWFKTMTTNAYIKLVYENKANQFNKKLWQRNFYDNIIKSEEEYLKISKYTNENILKWEEDKFYYTEV